MLEVGINVRALWLNEGEEVPDFNNWYEGMEHFFFFIILNYNLFFLAGVIEKKFKYGGITKCVVRYYDQTSQCHEL